MLENFDTITVNQKIEAIEALTGIETRNKYAILDPNDTEILYAYEESSFLARLILRGHRPLRINIVDREGTCVLVAKRSFFWILSHLEVFRPDGSFLGRMQRRLKLIGRSFDLTDDQGTVAEIRGPLLRPNTFWITKLASEKQKGFDTSENGEVELAKITKKWGGMMREALTAADTFRVEYTDVSLSESLRWLTLGAAFAIDLDFFESKGNR